MKRADFVTIFYGVEELYKLDGSSGAELKRCYCWGMEDLYFKILELAGYDEKQRLDMYHKLTSR